MRVLDLGHLEYHAAWAEQRRIAGEFSMGTGADTLILVQHPPVLTLGASFHEENLKLTNEEYQRLGIALEKTDRGGDVTYHGPGQLVVYPIFDLTQQGKDLHLWLRNLEEATILTLASFGLKGRRFPPHTGVWIDDEKVAAIGIKVSKWISLHGIAINCDNDLEAFNTIIPCGIEGYGVTSLSRASGSRITPEDVKPSVVSAFRALFTT